MSKMFKGLGRQSFIDFARGFVMIVMSWDHVSSFWQLLHHGGEGVLGEMPPFASNLWFLERFVSHWCAPTFVFLAGTVLAMSTASRLARGVSQKDISFHMVIRGVVLLILEVVLVSPAFEMPPYYFGVIACIGVCFILFSVIRFIPKNVILGLSLFTVLFHSYLSLDWIPMTSIANRYLRIILHEPNYNSWPFCGLYPLIPWIGVMGLGWCFGDVIRKLQVPFSKLRNAIFLTGVSSITLFFIIRWLRSFGNLLPRRGNTLIDWLYVSKYPPSVAFLLWGLGGMCIFLSIGLWIQENDIKNRLSDAILDIGKVPLFYYLTHLWLFRFRLPTPPPPSPPPYPLEMWQTLIFWVVGNIILWQLCKRYYMFKREHPDSPLKYI